MVIYVDAAHLRGEDAPSGEKVACTVLHQKKNQVCVVPLTGKSPIWVLRKYLKGTK